MRKDFLPCGPGFGTLEEVDRIADKREDRGPWLPGLALVLEVIRLLVELLRRNHLPLLRERVMIISRYEVAGIKRFHGLFFCFGDRGGSVSADPSMQPWGRGLR